jgi:hypothetical protein
MHHALPSAPLLYRARARAWQSVWQAAAGARPMRVALDGEVRVRGLREAELGNTFTLY